ncbi:MAG TPA: hypothetical protein VES42_06515 [Pilimelia sp.]|nr:hypothetical protein [Pilimelia sp.]
MRSRAALLPVVLCALLVAACGGAKEPVHYQADWQVFEATDTLFEEATLVVEATPTGPGVSEELHIGGEPDETSVYTVSEVKITRVLKGSASEGDRIKVKQLGGEVDGVEFIEDETVYLAAEKPYLLFLETYPDAPASLLNPKQAQYPKNAAGDFVSLPGNELTMTKAELARLAPGK